MGAVQGTHVSVTIDNTAAARITADARTRVIHILAETGMILFHALNPPIVVLIIP
jgi:hypothetical protein